MSEQDIPIMQQKIKRLIEKGDELFGQMQDHGWLIEWRSTFPSVSWKESMARWKKAMDEWEAEVNDWEAKSIL